MIAFKATRGEYFINLGENMDKGSVRLLLDQGYRRSKVLTRDNPHHQDIGAPQLEWQDLQPAAIRFGSRSADRRVKQLVSRGDGMRRAQLLKLTFQPKSFVVVFNKSWFCRFQQPPVFFLGGAVKSHGRLD